MHEAIVQWRIVVVLSITVFMPPPWTTWVTFVQPPVLTRSQGRRCQVIQREFIESLIRDLGADFRVAFKFALPRSDRVWIRPLWRILEYDCIILEFGVLGRRKSGITSLFGAAPLSLTAFFKQTTESLRLYRPVNFHNPQK